MKNKTKTEKPEREIVENRLVFITSSVFIYAILLLFIQKMSSDSMTIDGALAFIKILHWASLAGAMACAAWSAYKEKKGFFLYCGACLFIFWTTAVLTACKISDHAYYIDYLALAIAFIMSQIYFSLRMKGKFNSKQIRTIYIIVCVLLALVLAALIPIERYMYH